MIVFDTDTDVSPVAAAPAPVPAEEHIQSQTSDAAASDSSPPSKYDQLRRAKVALTCKVKGWAHNGLDVELEDGTIASMPNNHIDLDPDRNIANYFGKQVQVR